MSTSATKRNDVAQELSGTWFNQLGSCLDLHVDDAGRITGTFRSSVGGVDGGYEVTGFVAGDPGGPEVAIGFTVAWTPAHSLTVWAGHYHRDAATIVTTWLLSEASSPHGEWRSTSVGHDVYQRSRAESGALGSMPSSEPRRALGREMGGPP